MIFENQSIQLNNKLRIYQFGAISQPKYTKNKGPIISDKKPTGKMYKNMAVGLVHSCESNIVCCTHLP